MYSGGRFTNAEMRNAIGLSLLCVRCLFPHRDTTSSHMTFQSMVPPASWSTWSIKRFQSLSFCCRLGALSRARAPEASRRAKHQKRQHATLS